MDGIQLRKREQSISLLNLAYINDFWGINYLIWYGLCNNDWRSCVECRDSDCSKSLETLCEGSMLFGTAISYSFFSKLFQCLPWPATTTVECFFIFMSQIHLKSFLCSRGSELPTPFNPIMIIFLNYYIIKYPLRQKQEVIDIIDNNRLAMESARTELENSHKKGPRNKNSSFYFKKKIPFKDNFKFLMFLLEYLEASLSGPSVLLLALVLNNC